MLTMTAKQFLTELSAFQTKAELENVQKYFRDEGVETKFLGIRMKNIFLLAKKFAPMPSTEIGKLLDSKFYEARMGAVSIMDFQARDKKITAERKKELFDLYISKHDCINNWDLVDRAAPHVIGGYLSDKPRKILYKLAKSNNVWERRTAIVATYYFIRQDDVEDTFRIAEILIHDKHDLINKAVGSWIREAGKRDQQKLLAFLDKYVSSMPRITLRYSIEKLDKKSKDIYLKAAVK
jgi:3-methyladenine DNA glycosylase AlkD